MKIRLGQKTTRAVSRLHNVKGWENRAMYGVVALGAQPFFDYKNPDVDEKTQKYSVIKTASKIAIGTVVGVSVRAIFQKWGENLFDKNAFDTSKLGIKNLDKAKFKGCVGNAFSIFGAIVGMLTIDLFLLNKSLSHFNKKFIKEDNNEKPS